MSYANNNDQRNDHQRNDDQGKTKTFYHYTDDAGAKGIEESGVIKGSSRDRGDAVFGGGAYFPTVPPEMTRHTTTDSWKTS